MKFTVLILLSLLLVTQVSGEETVGHDYRDGIIESVGQPEIKKIPIPIPRPKPKGISSLHPRKKETKWQGGQSKADFTRVSRSMTNEPIWPKFADLFNRCAPGCAPKIASLRASRAGKSCHPSGNAIDISAITCGGVTSKAGQSSRFDNFVKCARGQRHGRRKWTVLYKESHKMRRRDCRKWRSMITRCHWDHVHLDVGC